MGNPLFKKLGLKDGQKVILEKIPDNYFDLLIEIPEVMEAEEGEQVDFVHIFETKLDLLQLVFKKNALRLNQDGMIWISWPKKTSGVFSEIDYHSAKSTAMAHGFVDVKICAIDSIWTACKYVIPKKNRNQ